MYVSLWDRDGCVSKPSRPTKTLQFPVKWEGTAVGAHVSASYGEKLTPLVSERPEHRECAFEIRHAMLPEVE